MRRAAAAVLLALAIVPAAAAHDGPATVEGTLRGWHGDTLDVPVDVGVGIDTTVSGVVRLVDPPAGHGTLVGRQVRAQGIRKGQTLALGGSTVTPTSSANVAAVSGTKNVAVLLFNFANDTRQPWTTGTVRSVVFEGTSSVAAYYRDASYGALTLTGDVHGWYTIDASNSGCDYTTWANQARAKATEAGVALGGYQFVVYAFPQVSGCGWAGLAYLPGSGSWINGAMTLRVVAHELGHNLGVHHASTLACSDAGTPSILAGTCTANEYGDPFTVMGASSSRLHVNWQRAQLGWEVGTQTITAAGTYTVAPAELTSPSPKLLRIARGDGTFLNLEYRQPFGTFDAFGATDPAVTGVSVRVAPEVTSRVQSKLIDANPSTSTFADAPFGVGRTLVDPRTNVSITVVSVSPLGATVSVQFAPDGVAPTTPTGLTATAQSSTSVRLAWAASSDAVGVAGYRILRGGVQVYSTDALSWTDSGLVPAATYTYSVVAFDAAGNVSAPATTSITTPELDATPPTAPSALTATVSRNRKVDLTWAAATDDVGVAAYRVLRGGVVVGTTTTRTFRDSPGRGTFTYTVVAVDAAGNVGPASTAVTVRT